ncbi:MAG: dihydroorotate dehydrogenase electron transfer subunit, partial [Oscillospiraceae bacterium]|nr:dihydroorotate dehydrogenase electron transfer subunit [Oscillospiraceae bacterium]
GTKELVRCVPGTELDVLSGLGNGFDMTLAGERPVLVGGGIGIAPLYGLAQRLLEQGKTPTVVLGFRSGKDAFYLDEFAKLGCQLLIATEDGSLGVKGFVTDSLSKLPDCDYVFTCGPLPMLKAVHSLPQLKGGQFSFEARMGCGFGACMGCTVPTKDGYKRVCKDGPILYKEEIVW